MTQKKSEEKAIEMFVGGLVLDPNTQAPVVVLKDEAGEFCLPIWIGVAEATSIASAIKQVTMTRPLTHDLMHDVFQEIGVRVQRVVITELKDSTYFAELILGLGDKVILIDSRPSDAIAIALRESAPIYVMQAVLDQAKVVFQLEQGVPPMPDANPGEGQPEGGQPAEGAEEGETEEPRSPDFKNVSKDKWEDLLEKLDPDDFKYKM